MSAHSVLTIGETLIELRPSGLHELRWTFAGDALNCAAAVSAAHPHADVKHLTAVGDDARSKDLLAFCTALGVDASDSPVVPGKSLGLYWISTEGGDRRFAYWRGDSAARHHLGSGDFAVPEPTFDLVIFSGITLAVAGESAASFLDEIAKARSAGATIAYDTNHRPALWPDADVARQVSESALATADIVHASADDVDALWNSCADIVQRWPDAFDLAEVLVTDGDRPTRLLTKDDDIHVPVPSVEVVDTSGAGDAFFGTYLGHRLAGVEALDSLDRAHQISEAVVQTPGALGHLLNSE